MPIEQSVDRKPRVLANAWDERDNRQRSDGCSIMGVVWGRVSILIRADVKYRFVWPEP